MKYTIPILFVFLGFNSICQNIVPNYDFELMENCPYNYSQTYCCSDWQDLWNMSSDYFNSCSTDTIVGVPFNHRGYQPAYSGDGYIGFYTGGPCSEYREYVGCTLKDSLVVGTRYYISMRVNAANKNGCYSSNIGMLFSKQTMEYFYPINNFDHINSGCIIMDTVNWFLVSGSFIADERYKHFYIGNFYESDSTDYFFANDWNDTSYYYLDYVCISDNPNTCYSTQKTENNYLFENIQISPNPMTNRAIVTFINNNNSSSYSIVLYDLNGNVVSRHDNISTNVFVIEKGNLQKGLYFLKISINRKTYIVKKLVIL